MVWHQMPTPLPGLSRWSDDWQVNQIEGYCRSSANTRPLVGENSHVLATRVQEIDGYLHVSAAIFDSLSRGTRLRVAGVKEIAGPPVLVADNLIHPCPLTPRAHRFIIQAGWQARAFLAGEVGRERRFDWMHRRWIGQSVHSLQRCSHELNDPQMERNG